MPPKRRDREGVEGAKACSGNGGHVQTHLQQSDHDLFLQAFEKPTQIYRYLRTRNMISPVFLHRNLTYMKHRSSRTNKARSAFRIDSLLASKLKNRNDSERLGDYMTLMFLGFFDKSISEDEVVEVETFLSQISHKKRKDSSKAMQERMGTSIVKINPDDSNMCSGKISAVSVPTDNFKAAGNDQRKSYILQLNVTVSTNFSHMTSITNGIEESTAKRPRPLSHINYESELVVFDKQSRCLLTEGEYELSLKERPLAATKNYSPKKHPMWDTIPDSGIASLDKSAFEDFQVRPMLKFRLAWTKEKCAALVDRPLPITVKKHDPLMNGATSISAITSETSAATADAADNAKETSHNNNSSEVALPSGTGVDYHFIYNNNTRQQTEACENYHCPWCSLNCITLYALLKHLKLCHSRFNFTYVETPTDNDARARIDVCINELFDGSYTGSPNDLVGPSGFAFSRAGPVRRTIVTRILVCRPRRLKPTLAEFLEIDENELNSQRPYITGHNRLYHHTMTCLPVHPKELDIDSEGENDPAWLQQKTIMMIDEFTDVNEGEKELMKMWNLHIMKNGYVGDIQIPLACEMFIDLKGRELLERNLYRNFVMHMCNLADYGLVSADVQYRTIRKLQRLLSASATCHKSVTTGRMLQTDHWTKVGLAKQKQKQFDELAKKNAAALNASSPELTALVPRLTPHRNEPELRISLPRISSVPSKEELAKREKLNAGAKGRENKPNKNGVQSVPIAMSSNNNNTNNKRRFSHLRDSPPRRRSAGASLLVQQPNGTIVNPTTTASAASSNQNNNNSQPSSISKRRGSIASIGAGSSMVSRKRMSLQLNKVDAK